MNEKKEILHPVSDAERCRFFEKIFKELEFIAIFVFIVLINSEKHISLSKRLSPISLIAKETLEFKSKTISKIKNEKFMQIPNKTIFIIKLNG